MCLTLALAHGPRLGILATDTRMHRRTVDGEILASDPGGKLRHIPGGFVAATGDATVGFEGLDRLDGLDARDRDAVQETVVDAYRDTAGDVRRAYADGQPEETYWFVLARNPDRPRVYRVRATGEIHEDPETNLLLGWPFEDDGDVARHQEAFLEALREPGSLDDFLQRVARLFRHVAADDDRVSGTLDLALVMSEGRGIQTEAGPDFTSFWRLQAPAEQVALARTMISNLLTPAPEKATA